MAALPDIIGNTIGGYAADAVAGNLRGRTSAPDDAPSKDSGAAQKGGGFYSSPADAVDQGAIVARAGTAYNAQADADAVAQARRLTEFSAAPGSASAGEQGDIIVSTTRLRRSNILRGVGSYGDSIIDPDASWLKTLTQLKNGGISTFTAGYLRSGSIASDVRFSARGLLDQNLDSLQLLAT